MNKRMNRNKLNIGTYILRDYAQTEKHVKELRECGIDFVIGFYPHQNKRALLNLFDKYGIGLISTNGLGWWGGDGSNAGKYATEHPVEKFCYYAEKFKDHPCIWGIDIGDEPSAVDFPYCGMLISFILTNLLI